LFDAVYSSPSILTMGLAMIFLIWSATFKGFLTLVINTAPSLCVRMAMSPKSTILPKTVLSTSKSEKPEGTITDVFVAKIPVLTSRLSLRRTYWFEARSNTKCSKLNNHTRKNNNPVHNAACKKTKVKEATPSANSSQTTKTATTKTRTVLATTLGKTHGLLDQTGETELSEDALVKF
jgi:hypothetical protein